MCRRMNKFGDVPQYVFPSLIDLQGNYESGRVFQKGGIFTHCCVCFRPGLRSLAKLSPKRKKRGRKRNLKEDGKSEIRRWRQIII